MYALANITKFVEDNADRLGDRAEGILERAKKVAFEGIISGGSIEEIMNDPFLASEFHNAVVNDIKHVAIGLSALRVSGKATA